MIVVRKVSGSTANRNAVASTVASARPGRALEVTGSGSVVTASTATYAAGYRQASLVRSAPMSRRPDDATLAAFFKRRSGAAARARELAERLREGEDPVRRAIRGRQVAARARAAGRSGLV